MVIIAIHAPLTFSVESMIIFSRSNVNGCEMTDLNIEDIAARHHNTYRAGPQPDYCDECGTDWPCDAVQLLDFAGELAEKAKAFSDTQLTYHDRAGGEPYSQTHYELTVILADPNTQALLKRMEAKDEHRAT